MINDINEMISFIQGQKRSEKKNSLDRFLKILEIYGSPHLGKKYIHVGGTNGKGSVVTYIKNILMEKGYNVATFTSPYVICFNERIQYNDTFILDNEIIEIGNFIISKYDELDQLNLSHPTFFEFVTLMAFLYFQKKDIDYAIIEVGIGGTLDSTNVIDPIISVISNVNYDHMNILGNTLEEIALNKLGIVKPNKVLITISNPNINDLIKEEVNKKHAKLILVNPSDIKDVKIDVGLMEFNYLKYNIKSHMLGLYQAENIIVSINAILELANRENIDISKEIIEKGIYNSFWPGRFQIVNNNPLIIIDGAHNIDGINRLCETIRIIKGYKRLNVIFAVSKDKEKDKMIELLLDVADEIIFTSFDYKRSDDPNNLLSLSNPNNNKINKSILDDIDSYIAKIKNENKNEIYLFCGSLYFVSELLPKFK